MYIVPFLLIVNIFFTLVIYRIFSQSWDAARNYYYSTTGDWASAMEWRLGTQVQLQVQLLTIMT